jgi:hypothetical protein
MAFTSYGLSVGIRTNDESIFERIDPLLPPSWEPLDEPVVDALFSLRVGPPPTRKGQRNFHLLYAGATRIARNRELPPVLETLESQLHLSVAALAKEDHLFVHAGVVGWRGKAIVLPGRSGVGKTTLVSALLKAGATYYSDDMAIFDPLGRVHPYPVALSIREEEGRCKYPPDAFGGSRIGHEPLDVGLVLVTQYKAGARWCARRLTPGRGLSALLDNTVSARRQPMVAIPTLARVVDGATVLKTKRDDAATVVERLLRAADWA